MLLCSFSIFKFKTFFFTFILFFFKGGVEGGTEGERLPVSIFFKTPGNPMGSLVFFEINEAGGLPDPAA